MYIRLLLFLLCLGASLLVQAQQTDLEKAVGAYFRQYACEGYKPHDPMRMDSLVTDAGSHEVWVYANEPFCSQPFTPQTVKRIYAALQRLAPAPYNTYRWTVWNKKGLPIEDLVPNILREDGTDPDRLWGTTNYGGLPWVKNLSQPYQVTEGL